VSERIQKALANAGLGSRREIERWVAEGRITIDGRVAKIGDQLKGRERICLDGRPVKSGRTKTQPGHQFVAYYAPGARAGGPRRDTPADRDTERKRGPRSDSGSEVIDVPRPKRGRWIDVAPLDPSTSGLLILTTDGDLANRLARPGARIEREYSVRVLGELSEGQLHDLTTGIELDEGLSKVDSVKPAGGEGQNRWYNVVLRDSRHRKVRATLAGVGATPSRLIRIRFGAIALGKLRRGQNRALDAGEVAALYAAAGLTRDDDNERNAAP